MVLEVRSNTWKVKDNRNTCTLEDFGRTNTTALKNSRCMESAS